MFVKSMEENSRGRDMCTRSSAAKLFQINSRINNEELIGRMKTMRRIISRQRGNTVSMHRTVY